jgi:hypothetical protein
MESNWISTGKRDREGQTSTSKRKEKAKLALPGEGGRGKLLYLEWGRSGGTRPTLKQEEGEKGAQKGKPERTGRNRKKMQCRGERGGSNWLQRDLLQPTSIACWWPQQRAWSTEPRSRTPSAHCLWLVTCPGIRPPMGHGPGSYTNRPRNPTLLQNKPRTTD